MTFAKKFYSTPKLIIHGDVEVITQSIANRQTALDATFPTGTPFNELTFT